MKLKSTIIHLVIVGVLSIGFISGCREEVDPKYKSYLCPRCYEIIASLTESWAGISQCPKCLCKYDDYPNIPWCPSVEEATRTNPRDFEQPERDSNYRKWPTTNHPLGSLETNQFVWFSFSISCYK